VPVDYGIHSRRFKQHVRTPIEAYKQTGHMGIPFLTLRHPWQRLHMSSSLLKASMAHSMKSGSAVFCVYSSMLSDIDPI
jgi:hypothetical protein